MFEISVLSAALGGLIVFFSPCVLPIVPFYLSYMAGVGMGELQGGALAPGARRRAVGAAVMFSLGIVTVFVLLGAAAFGLSQAFRAVQTEFRIVAALIVGIMGLHFLGLIRVPFLNRSFSLGEGGDVRQMSVGGAYLVGLAFAAGWTPCVGGVLTGVIFTASQEASAWEGLGLMLVFGLAMTAPFVVAALFVEPFLRFVARFRRFLPWVEKAMGALLLVFAALIATDQVNAIANWMLTTFPIFLEIG
ncbi:sulfite exporter TauE/SafE family protein [Jannaschia sp. Os4]|uniref:cytochrome c biogenesis CcdA family protein n=1 Tax=Jannaschia sp. Os4 TaxID=2807617 RepID=UPI00193AC610|nr:cytochrome c biogenesis protein CcdA [Jannaschia sp. Os4]MBM2576321.1 sulfite exporter TauE/SafE family protein [Jannaschia sp. Os4]